MKKSFLLTLLSLLVCSFGMSAVTFTFTIPTACGDGAVRVTTGSGMDISLKIQNYNETELTEDDNPLTFEPAAGIEINSITVYNGNNNDIIARVGMSGDGKYHYGVDPTYDKLSVIIDCKKTDEVSISNIYAFDAYDEGNTRLNGVEFGIAYKDGEEWKEPTHSPYSGYAIPQDATVRVTPPANYEILKIDMWDGTLVETTALEDGSVTMTNYHEYYYQNLRVHVQKNLPAGYISYTLDVDNPDNVVAYYYNGTTGEGAEAVALQTGKNTIDCLPSVNPLVFQPIGTAKIVSITKNGEDVQPISGGWISGWVVEIENGDDIVVRTMGKYVPVKLIGANTVSAEGKIAAQPNHYKFEGSEGVYTLNAVDGNYSIQARVGEVVTVTPLPGTSHDYLVTDKGGKTNDWSKTFIVGAPFNPADEAMEVLLYGTRFSGVKINVNDTEAIDVTPSAGRGDALTLADGENGFALTDIEFPLAITPKIEGTTIMSVKINDQNVAPSADGNYTVNTLVDGDYLDIQARRAAVDVSVSFNLPEEATMDWLKITVAGEPVKGTNPMTVKSYQPVVVAAAPGYSLYGVMARPVQDHPDWITSVANGDGSWTVTANSSQVTEIMLAPTLMEANPQPGYAYVIPEVSDMSFTIYECDENKEMVRDDNGVIKLIAGEANQVKLGHYVRLYKKSSSEEWDYVKANGEDVTPDGRNAYIEINGRTRIEAATYVPVNVFTSETFGENFAKIGTIKMLDANGNKVSNMNARVGETITFVAEPATGYVLDYIEIQTTPARAIEGLEYTITAEDGEWLGFKGVFKLESEESPLTVRTNKAYILDESGNIVIENQTVVGNVILKKNGETVPEFSGMAGDTVDLDIEPLYPDKSYVVVKYVLVKDFPNREVSNPYVLSKDDADAEGVIWIAALVKDDPSGIDAVLTDGSDVEIYDLQGRRINSKELPQGIYIVKQGDKTYKVIR